MVFNATFNNFSVISWPSVLLVEETGGPGEKTADLPPSFKNNFGSLSQNKKCDGEMK
jgi:hypothetical protein